MHRLNDSFDHLGLLTDLSVPQTLVNSTLVLSVSRIEIVFNTIVRSAR